MRLIENVIGKRLKAKEETTKFLGFPNSDSVEIMPKGAVSGIIYSYLPKGNGWFQIENEEGAFFYVADNQAVEVVSQTAQDESSIFGRIDAATGSFLRNGGSWITKNTGFVTKGFTESIDLLDSKAEKYIRYALIGGALILAIQIFKLLND